MKEKVCPVCGNKLEKVNYEGIELDKCEEHGVWFDKGELEQLKEKLESSNGDDGFVSGMFIGGLLF